MKKILLIGLVLLGILIIGTIVSAIGIQISTTNEAVKEIAAREGKTEEEIEQQFIDEAPDKLRNMWEIEINQMVYDCTRDIQTYNACKSALEKII